MIKPSPHLLCRAYSKNKHNSGFSLVELTVVMAVIGILMAAGLYGFQQYLANANGSACTQQLGDMNTAVNTVLSLNDLSRATTPSASVIWFSNAGGTYAIDPYMGGKLVGNGANQIHCPAYGSYAAPGGLQGGDGWETADIVQYPTCSLCDQGNFANTRLHALVAGPAANQQP